MKEHGSGSHTTEVFVVEARTSSGRPQQHGGMILGSEWREVRFPKAPIGVPNLCLYPDAVQHGFMNWEAAVALANWFMAMPDDDKTFAMPALCVETRIVKIRYKFEYSTEELGVTPAINMIDLRRRMKFEPRASAKGEKS